MTGHITPEMKYVVEQLVPCYGVDGRQRLKPAAFMDMAQEIAYLAAGAMHFGYDELASDGTAWVLSRICFRFLETPSWRDEVSLYTWHKGPYGPFYVRDFSLEGKDGRKLVAATSSWVILDVASRRMMRTNEITEMIPESTVCHEDAIAEPASKVMIPRGAATEEAGEHVVAYSDVDLLGHTNNARYVVWAMDCIPYEVAAEKEISEVPVNFNHETRPGDVVKMVRYREGDVFYVEGLTQDKAAFCAKIVFKA